MLPSSGGKKGKLPTMGSLGACFSSGGAVDLASAPPVKGHADADADDDAAAVDLARARIACRWSCRDTSYDCARLATDEVECHYILHLLVEYGECNRSPTSEFGTKMNNLAQSQAKRGGARPSVSSSIQQVKGK